MPSGTPARSPGCAYPARYRDDDPGRDSGLPEVDEVLAAACPQPLRHDEQEQS